MTKEGYDGEGMTKEVEMFGGRPRYLVLSDGKVLDRAHLPIPNPVSAAHRVRMLACNRANETDFSRGMSPEERLALAKLGRATTQDKGIKKEKE